MANEEFNKKLLEGENPFPSYPEPPRRPSFIIGGDTYLEWFKELYNNRTKQDGTECVFIVGMPGAGKTHFLRHLDYLFYEKGDYQGIFAISRLSDLEIDEKEIWKELFLNPDSIKRLSSLIPKERISNSEIRSDIKLNLLKLIDQSLDMDSLSIEVIRKIAECVTNLLPNQSIICFALDNIEEYLSARETEYLVRAKTTPEEISTKQKASTEAVKMLVEKIRNMTSDLKRAIVLLALTTPAWAEVRKTEPARTKGRRFKFAEEEQVITELTLHQCFKLVHEYMKQWCAKNDVELPLDDDCMCNVGSEKLSIFPFTPLAIEVAYRVTDQLAGDIVCFCSECVNKMRNKGQVEVIRDELTIENLLRITKEYPWLGWVEHARTLLEEMGPTILEKTLARRLADIERSKIAKYRPGISVQTIVNSIERFADIIGVVISRIPPVENSFNPSAKPIQPSDILKIWSFGETKIAVRYVIGKEQEHFPSARIHGGKTKFQDYVDLISLIDAEKASHGLLLLIWAVEDYSQLGFGLQRRISELGNTLTTISLDSDLLYKVIAVAEATEYQKDLAIFVDKIYVHLSEKLAFLAQQKRPPRSYDREKYTRYY
jgi:hypothetical protein